MEIKAAPRRCLVVGSGSIARRHISNLRKILPNTEVACISASGRVLLEDETDSTLILASMELAIEWSPEFCIVASPAPYHIKHAKIFLQLGIPVLIEKPLSDSLSNVGAEGDFLYSHRNLIQIAYNLRYLSSAREMKRLIRGAKIGHIYSVHIDVGQYLPDWRPQSDYRHNVSANKKLGGGVLLELSHEFDYLLWLFGQFNKVYCITSLSRHLEIDVEDSADIILSRNDGLVAQLHMDFLQKRPTRKCKVIGELGTLLWDLRGNTIFFENGYSEERIFSDPNSTPNDSYIQLLRNFIDTMFGNGVPQNTLEDGISVLEMIEAMRHSSLTGLPAFIKSI